MNLYKSKQNYISSIRSIKVWNPGKVQHLCLAVTQWLSGVAKSSVLLCVRSTLATNQSSQISIANMSKKEKPVWSASVWGWTCLFHTISDVDHIQVEWDVLQRCSIRDSHPWRMKKRYLLYCDYEFGCDVNQALHFWGASSVSIKGACLSWYHPATWCPIDL